MLSVILRIRIMIRTLLVLTILAPATFAQSAKDAADNWHQWRGPDATGVSRSGKPPVEWSESKNIQWKIEVPGDGSSVPIIWGDKVFITSAVNTGKVDPSLPAPEDQKKKPSNPFNVKNPNTSFEYTTFCFDRNAGKQLWKDVAIEKIPHEGVHRDNDFASASPTTDGQRLWVWFGSAGLYCYDLSGKQLWKKQFGEVRMGALLGEGSSPVFHKGKLILVRDSAEQSYIMCLDASTGDEIWRKSRDEGNAWATPRVVTHSGKTQVVMPGTNAIRSYDIENGDIIWQCSGLTSNAIPCPVVDGDVVYCMTGYKGHKVMAVPLSSKGSLSGDKIVWSGTKGTPYIASPVLYAGRLYFNKSLQNILTCLDAKTGEEVIGQTRLPTTGIYASPVAASGHIYFTDRKGTTIVLESGDVLDIVAENKLDERFDSSGAIAGNQLFLRGARHLYCIAETP